MKRLVMLALFALVTLVPTAHADEFAAGLMARHDPVAARAHFAHAALQFDHEWTQSPSVPLAVNRGRARFLAGDLPGAIQAFHDGLELAPTNVLLQQSLGECRAIVAYPQGLHPEPLTAWQHRVATFDLLIASTLCAGFVIVGVGRWITTRDGWTIPVMVVGVCGWLAIGAFSVQIQRERQRDHEHPIQVLAKETVLRSGNGTAFLPRLDGPLPRGAEVRYRLERGGWVQVELPGNVLGWLPQDAIR